MGNDRMIRFSWWRQLVDAETMAAAGKRRPDAEKKNGKRGKKKNSNLRSAACGMKAIVATPATRQGLSH